MSGGGAGDVGGMVSHRTVLDLSHLTSAEELASITGIERVVAVIVPAPLAAAYAKIPTTRVATTVFVPADAKVRVHTGVLVVGGDGLGADDDVLVVVGMLVITSPVTGAVPQRITVVGSVIAPKGSESALGPALTGCVGNVSYYRYAEGQDVKVLTGQVQLSGAMLANPAGQAEDVLVAAGQVVVTGPVTKVGYARVVVAGQLVAPAAGRDQLEPWLDTHGQVLWYRSERPRVLFGDTRLDADFFRLLDQPTSLVVLGDLTVAPGVSEDVLREKVSDIVLLGDVTAPAEVVPVLQMLAVDALGEIRTDDGSGY
jgi:hypothetical protein